MNTLSKNYYPWLDWLRFLAAFLVVLAHTRMLIFAKWADLEEDSRNIFTSIFFAITRLGNECVLMFFVLSGFLVGGVAAERLIKNTFDLKKYTIDRTTRIMVPLIPAILLMAVVSIYLGLPLNYWYMLGNTFGLQDILVPTLEENAALWTLGYEMWFYFFVGAVGLYKFKKSVSLLMFALFIAAFTKLMPHYFICWSFGIAAYLWRPRRSSKLLITALLFMAYGCIGRQVGRGSESIDIAFLSQFLPSEEWARIVFSAGFAFFVQQIILINSFPRLEKLGTLLASFSYTLYLIHFPIVHLFSGKGLQIKNTSAQSIGLFISIILSTIIAALIAYYLFERNTSLVRNKVIKLCAPKHKLPDRAV